MQCWSFLSNGTWTVSTVMKPNIYFLWFWKLSLQRNYWNSPTSRQPWKGCFHTQVCGQVWMFVTLILSVGGVLVYTCVLSYYHCCIELLHTRFCSKLSQAKIDCEGQTLILSCGLSTYRAQDKNNWEVTFTTPIQEVVVARWQLPAQDYCRLVYMLQKEINAYGIYVYSRGDWPGLVWLGRLLDLHLSVAAYTCTISITVLSQLCTYSYIHWKFLLLIG